MKYFTKDLWRRMQEDESCDFSNAYVRLWKKYDNQLRRMGGRISKRARHILSNTELHAAHIASISVKQARALTRPGHKHERRVDITITLRGAPSPKETIYTINYSRVTKYTLDFPTDDPLNFLCTEELDSWGYDELSLSRGKLKHEIIFHSGGVMSIVFDKLSLKKVVCSPKGGPAQS